MQVINLCQERTVILTFHEVVNDSKYNWRSCVVFINDAIVATHNVDGMTNHSPAHWGVTL